jgi:hypothetical protein
MEDNWETSALGPQEPEYNENGLKSLLPTIHNDAIE